MNRTAEPFMRFDDEPIYNTKAVVQRTGISADTLRAWERRYGVPQPRRTSGRHRAYSERDLALITWLHAQVEQGVTISQAVAMLDKHHSSVLAPDINQQKTLTQLQSECLSALLSYDTVYADHALSQAFSMYPVETVCLELIQPMLVQIGNGWHSGTVSIAQEHAATAFIRTKLAALITQAHTNSQRGFILLAAAPHEHHDLGLMMVGLFLLRRGWKIVYLGSDLPGDELITTVQHLQPDLVAIGATTYESRALAAVLLDAIAHLPNPPILGYGGIAFNTVTPDLRGHFLGKNALEACNIIEALLLKR